MTNCTGKKFDFPACKKRKVEAEFSGGNVTSDGGVVLLGAVDRLLGLTAAVAKTMEDVRDLLCPWLFSAANA